MGEFEGGSDMTAVEIQTKHRVFCEQLLHCHGGNEATQIIEELITFSQATTDEDKV